MAQTSAKRLSVDDVVMALAHVKLVVLTVIVPPVMRADLVSGMNDLGRRPGGEVTRNGGLDVDAHPATVALLQVTSIAILLRTSKLTYDDGAIAESSLGRASCWHFSILDRSATKNSSTEPSIGTLCFGTMWALVAEA